MALSQDTRIAEIHAAAVSDNLLLYRMTGSEQLSHLFEYELELLCESDHVDLKKLLGSTLTVSLQLPSGSKRYFNGLVTKLSQFGMLGRLYRYRVVINPKAWLLTRASDCKIYAKQNVPDIVAAVLKANEVENVEFHTTNGNYPVREYCVQYRETDFNFISRLLEEEGIYYYFKHTSTTHTIVFCDSKAAHETVAAHASINYYASNETTTEPEYLYEWCLNQEIRTGEYTLKDYDFTKPTSPLKVTEELTAKHPHANKKAFDYPGGYELDNVGKHYATTRIEEQYAEFERIKATGNVRALSCGSKFTLARFPRQDQNRAYLIIATHMAIQNNGYHTFGIPDSATPAYQCSYEVMNVDTVFRPARITPKPFVQGVQTAVVVGEKNEEITTDKYGRVKVQFHWDRLGKKDENSSCWIRVAQSWAGKQWGTMFIPRIGQEVVVDFLEGNPDCPIIIGSVYNQDNQVPYALPDNKTRSTIKSRSSLKGGDPNFNEIRFEDKKDSEEIYVHAEKDFKRVVENNDSLKVGFDKHEKGDQTIEIYNDRTTSLEKGNDSLTVKEGNKSVEVSKGDDALKVALGKRDVTVQKDHTLTVNMGNRAVNVKQGNDSLEVSMGNRSVKVSLGKITEDAMQGIELTVGQSSIKIDQMGVTIKGMMIKIEGEISTDVKGLMATVDGTAMLTVKGGIVMIN